MTFECKIYKEISDFNGSTETFEPSASCPFKQRQKLHKVLKRRSNCCNFIFKEIS